jgi:hypothetical protein
MPCTCKVIKRIITIPGRSNWTSVQWAAALLTRLQLGDWGMPTHVICDRDPKWTSELWLHIFTLMNVKHLYTTAWHSQGDGQSEVMNQLVEIFLCYAIASMLDVTNIPRLRKHHTSSCMASTFVLLSRWVSKEQTQPNPGPLVTQQWTQSSSLRCL